MHILTIRREFNLLLAASGLIVLVSYFYAGYLYARRAHPSLASAANDTAEGRQARIARLLARGERDLNKRKVEQALVEYREALSLNPGSLAAQLGIARGEMAAGREETAAAEYERARTMDPSNKAALLDLAQIYSHQKSTWRDAETRYGEYLNIAPDDAGAWLGLGRVLAWQGKSMPAAGIFARPDVARLMTVTDQRDYAFALVKTGDWPRAEAQIKKVLASRPDDTELRLQLAAIYAGQHRWNAAVPIYRELIASRPHDAQLQLSYGLGLLAMKNYRAALRPLEIARNAMPSSGEAGLSYARALKGSGNLKAAVKEYDRVIPRYSGNAAVVREYADALLERRDYRDAAKYYGVAHRLGVRDERFLVAYAGSLSGEGNYKAALPYMEEAYRRSPTPRVTFELAKLMQKLGRSDRARELLRQVDKGR